MKKKILLLVFFSLAIAVAVVLLRTEHKDDVCAFCEEEILERQKFYEDDHVLVLYSHKPIVSGHSLIIPKRHVERFEDLSDEELLHIKEAVIIVHAAAEEIYGASDYLLLQKNGAAAGQTVPHLHFHYFPRKEGEIPGPLFFLRFFLVPHLPSISDQEMAEATDQFRQFTGIGPTPFSFALSEQ